jgi:hypothetical protein
MELAHGCFHLLALVLTIFDLYYQGVGLLCRYCILLTFTVKYMHLSPTNGCREQLQINRFTRSNSFARICRVMSHYWVFLFQRSAKVRAGRVGPVAPSRSPRNVSTHASPRPRGKTWSRAVVRVMNSRSSLASTDKRWAVHYSHHVNIPGLRRRGQSADSFAVSLCARKASIVCREQHSVDMPRVIDM